MNPQQLGFGKSRPTEGVVVDGEGSLGDAQAAPSNAETRAAPGPIRRALLVHSRAEIALKTPNASEKPLLLSSICSCPAVPGRSKPPVPRPHGTHQTHPGGLGGRCRGPGGCSGAGGAGRAPGALPAAVPPLGVSPAAGPAQAAAEPGRPPGLPPPPARPRPAAPSRDGPAELTVGLGGRRGRIHRAAPAAAAPARRPPAAAAAPGRGELPPPAPLALPLPVLQDEPGVFPALLAAHHPRHLLGQRQQLAVSSRGARGEEPAPTLVDPPGVLEQVPPGSGSFGVQPPATMLLGTQRGIGLLSLSHRVPQSH